MSSLRVFRGEIERFEDRSARVDHGRIKNRCDIDATVHLDLSTNERTGKPSESES